MFFLDSITCECRFTYVCKHWHLHSLFSIPVIFQHLFNCAVVDIAEQVAATQNFAIELESSGTNQLMSLSFWKRAKLCRVFCRSRLPTTELTGELGSLSRLLSVISTSPDIVAISGCPVDMIRTIDHHASFPRGVQCCFRFELLDLQSFIHKSTFSVFGRIDMFSVLQCLQVSLGGSITEDWFLESSELVRVSLLLFLGDRENEKGRIGHTR